MPLLTSSPFAGRRVAVRVAGLALLGLSAGCGQPGPHIAPPLADACATCPDASPPTDASFDARPRVDAAGVEYGPDDVEVVSIDPSTSSDFVTGDRVTVTCAAAPDATTRSPVIAMTVDIDDVLGSRRSLTASSSGGDLWTAIGSLDGLGNGPLLVTCGAHAADGLKNFASKEFFLDLGPVITVVRPVAGAATHGTIHLEFQVAAAPATPGEDIDAEVDDVMAFIGSVEVTARMSETLPGRYTGSVPTNDPMLFSPPLVGAASFRVNATNFRGATRIVRVNFVVDNEAPIISIVEPVPGQLVGGIILVSAVVFDVNGVDPTSVVAVFGNGADALAAFPLTQLGLTDTFEGAYDSRELVGVVEARYGSSIELVYPSLTVRARDVPGNDGAVGQIVGMDYTPPLVSLDPPRVREGQISSSTGLLECSYDFDPLGEDAANDMQALPQLGEFRGRVSDRGNEASSSSSTYVPAAGIDETRVELFFLDNTNEGIAQGDALVVDTDGDGFCDDINPNLRPTTVPMSAEDALVINLAGIEHGGSSTFGAATVFDMSYPDCTVPDSPETSADDPLCPLQSGLQRVIKSAVGDDPALWGIPPIGDITCVGTAYDYIANNMTSGWACVALRATDRLGNVGVSRPIRVCFDHDGNGAEACPGLSSGYPWRDVEIEEQIEPSIPTADPNIDCTGIFNARTRVTDPFTNCTLPPTFATGELLRLDLD